MKNKGFTLVELLLTIVILSLVLLIAIPSVTGVSNIVRERQRKNSIKSIEIAASKYAFDTGKTLIFVDELIKEGYIESDNDGNIKDPINNKRLNCYAVEMEQVSDYYDAKFIDGKNYDENGVCNLNKLKEDSGEIDISVGRRGGSESLNSWLSGEITLSASSDTFSINCNTNKCVWTSSSGANVIGKTTIVINNVSKTLNTTYTFQYTKYDDTNDEIKHYKKSVNIKIDNELPIIYSDEIKITNKFVYTENKKVTISASDLNGSGIEGYYMALNSGQSCYNVSNTFQKSNTFTINKNGSYLICVKDKAGNISAYNNLSINYIK